MKNHAHRTIGVAFFALALSASMSSTHSQSSASASPSSRVVPRPIQSSAQSSRGADEALLREVRLIRETLQRAQGNAQREEMMVERIRTHDQRVERLDQQLTVLRDEIGGIEVHVRQTDQREKSLDLQIQRAVDPAQRQGLESERKELGFTQEAQRQRLDRLREREFTITAALQREERTLRGLEARLEALDRELEAEARKNKASGLSGMR
jgi:predicted  nucleic acid-binding Zn-ribbon protein